jgi:hypothetical protein
MRRFRFRLKLILDPGNADVSRLSASKLSAREPNHAQHKQENQKLLKQSSAEKTQPHCKVVQPGGVILDILKQEESNGLCRPVEPCAKPVNRAFACVSGGYEDENPSKRLTDNAAAGG